MSNPHEGHRQRLKSQFVKNGLQSLLPHQMLELLLFYAIPRVDTNVYAHNLLNKFGDLAGVFNASIEELESVSGIGENTAILIKLVSQMFRMYVHSSNEGVVLDNSQEVCKYFISQFLGVAVEEVHLVTLDENMRVVSNVCLSRGTEDTVSFEPRQAFDALLKSNCNNCILAHNHPKASCSPSKEDINTTENLARMFENIGARLVDHVIVGVDGARTIISGDAKYFLK